MEKLIAIIGVIAFALVGAIFISLLLSWPVMMLWNGCLVDAVPGIKEISWMQSWGIMILTGILFKETSVSFKK